MECSEETVLEAIGDDRSDHQVIIGVIARMRGNKKMECVQKEHSIA